MSFFSPTHSWIKISPGLFTSFYQVKLSGVWVNMILFLYIYIFNSFNDQDTGNSTDLPQNKMGSSRAFLFLIGNGPLNEWTKDVYNFRSLDLTVFLGDCNVIWTH